MSLAACGADSLDSIQGELTNDETVTVDLSLNDDGDLVVSLNDDNTDTVAPADSTETISFSTQ